MIIVLCSGCKEELHAVSNDQGQDFVTSVPCTRKERCPNWPTDIEPDKDSQLAFAHLEELKKAS